MRRTPGLLSSVAASAGERARSAPPVDAGASFAPRADPLLLIAETPWRYDFFHALRLIDAHHADKPLLGTARRPQDEVIRLGQAIELSFAASPIATVEMQGVGGWPRIDVRFMGLFGPNGPLPLHMTSYTRERVLHKGDETLARFADLFHHRMLLLFYRAWAQAQPVVSLDRALRPGAGAAPDRLTELVGSLVGMGAQAWHGGEALPNHARLALAGLLAPQVRSAEALARALTVLLGRPVRVEQFVGRWMALPNAERSRIGGRCASRRQSTVRLGTSTVLGRSVFDRQHHFRVHIGPLGLAEFQALLPVGAALPPLQAVVRQFFGEEFGWDLALALDPAERPQARLGRDARLGWTSWVGPTARRETCTLHLHPRSARPRAAPGVGA